MSRLDDGSPVEAYSDPQSRWRLGHAVGAYGTALLIVPAVVMAAVARDAQAGRCDTSPFLRADELPPGAVSGTCSTAVGAYAVTMLLLVGPTVVGLLITRPRRVGWWLGAVLTGALVAYLLLVVTGGPVRPA